MNNLVYSLTPLLLLAGCGDVSQYAASEATRAPSSMKQGVAGVEYDRHDMAGGTTLAFEKGIVATADDQAKEILPSSSDRKIIYRAEIDLVVKDFALVESSAPRLIAEHGGYVADMQISRNSGDNRTGKWVARLPVDRFDAFLDAASGLGIPARRQQSGQDVTEEFVDLDARLAAKKKLEERIITLLEEPYGEIKDLIEVERELARVRSEIEQMEGRRRYLVNQTTLTTVVVTAREEQDYTPPEAPGFGGRIAAAWGGSLRTLGSAGQALVVGGVSAAPWLLTMVCLVLPVWWVRSK